MRPAHVSGVAVCARFALLVLFGLGVAWAMTALSGCGGDAFSVGPELVDALGVGVDAGDGPDRLVLKVTEDAGGEGSTPLESSDEDAGDGSIRVDTALPDAEPIDAGELPDVLEQDASSHNGCTGAASCPSCSGLVDVFVCCRSSGACACLPQGVVCQ